MIGNNKYFNLWHNLTLFPTHPRVAWNRFINLYNAEDLSRQLHEVFIEQIYYKLFSELKPNTTLIDIGANIGDTAIYFAMNKNAKMVYSYEPIPKTYEVAKTNIEKSPYKSKIKLFNEAVGGVKVEYINLSKDYAGTGATKLEDASAISQSKRIKIAPISKILSDQKNVAIKCDAEGYEHNIFLDSIELSNVYAIELEYHGGPQRLPAIFKKQGFNVEVGKDKTGYLFAYRV